MNENIHPDIKTAQHIMITEFVSVIVFFVMGIYNSFGMFICIGVVLISIPVNIFWIVRLLKNKPPGYISYIIGLLLPVVTFVATGMWLLSAIMKIQC